MKVEQGKRQTTRTKLNNNKQRKKRQSDEDDKKIDSSIQKNKVILR